MIKSVAFTLVVMLANAASAQTDTPAASIGSAAPGLPAQVPATKHNAEATFFLDVARCLFSLKGSGGIEGLPSAVTKGLRPAAADERFSYRNDPSVKVWVQDPFGAHVVLAEKTADRCEVTADQLSVEETFTSTMKGIKHAMPGFIDVPVHSNYSDYSHQMESTDHGVRYVVHLEGSEPGGLAHPDRMLAGHAFRYTLLNAFVIRQPETAKPPFR